MFGVDMKFFNVIVINMIIDNQVKIFCDSGGYFGGLGVV